MGKLDLSAVKDPRFRRFWIGQSASAVGDGVFPVALALAVAERHGSASQLGVVLASAVVPRLLFILVGGVWADRLPRHMVMLGADALNAVAQVGIGGSLLLGGGLNMNALVEFSVLSGAAGAFFGPASAGLIPVLVESADIRSANVLSGISQQAASVLGPALATAFALTAGSGWAMLFNAATYVASVASLASLRVPGTVRARRKFWLELRDGWSELRARRWYWMSIVAHAAWNAGRATYQTLGPIIAVEALGGAASWGIITQCGVVGALIGSLIAARYRPVRPLISSSVGLALGALPLAALGLGSPPWLVGAFAGLMYAGLTIMQALWNTAAHEHIPGAVLSRVSSYDSLLSLGLSPIALALAGPLADLIGTRVTLLGAALLVSTPNLLLLVRRDIRTLGDSARAAGPVSAGPEA